MTRSRAIWSEAHSGDNLEPEQHSTQSPRLKQDEIKRKTFFCYCNRTTSSVASSFDGLGCISRRPVFRARLLGRSSRPVLRFCLGHRVPADSKLHLRHSCGHCVRPALHVGAEGAVSLNRFGQPTGVATLLALLPLFLLARLYNRSCSHSLRDEHERSSCIQQNT